MQVERFKKGLLGWSREEVRKPEHLLVTLWPVLSHGDREQKLTVSAPKGLSLGRDSARAWTKGVCRRLVRPSAEPARA